MIRKVLIAPDGAVLDAQRFEERPDTAALAAWLWGDADPPEGALDPAMGDERGTVMEAPDDQPIGVGWTWDGEQFVAPAPTLGEIPSADFLDLFTTDEYAALVAVPAFAKEKDRAGFQGTVNLASEKLAALLGQAVKAKLLTRARADAVLAGKPPG